jgi:alpha-tubulin suppressor-like RCC1 family protein
VNAVFSSSTVTAAKLCTLAVITAVCLVWLRPGPAVAAGPGVQVAGGGGFSCALSYGFEVLCWGENSRGQLGDGSGADRTFAVPVHLGEPADFVVTGQFHACAHTISDAVKCWGWNLYGQIGDGTSTNRFSPVHVGGLTNVAWLTAGSNHTCAVMTGGGVKCWGHNSSGQLGDGSTTDRSTPVNVLGLGGGVSAVEGGALHTCATMWGGGVKCWGDNSRGQIGDGTTINRTTPVSVSGLTGDILATAAGGLHTCAIPLGGPPRCWGWNAYGQLGDGTTLDRTTPVAVSGLPAGATDITAGFNHNCALTPNSGISCWGVNTYGQLGDGSTADRHAPVAVCADPPCSSPIMGIFDADAGGDHTCAVSLNAGPWCWGRNTHGQIGDDTTTQRVTPTEILGLGMIPGDVNCDKSINSIDAAIVLQFDAGLTMILPACFWGADLNYDGNYNAIDAAIILQVDAGLIVIGI